MTSGRADTPRPQYAKGPSMSFRAVRLHSVALSFARIALLAIAGSAAGLTLAPPARAAVVERIVAVVGDQAILLSDLRERARPFLVRIYDQVPPGAQRNAAISQVYRGLLDRMIEEELQRRAASEAQLAVTAEEVDQALDRIAAQNGLRREQIIAEATRTGMNERQYRDEVRRQVLEAKLLNLRLQGRIRVTEQDLRRTYQELVLQERAKLAYRAQWIVLKAPSTLEPTELASKRHLAEQVAARARNGADFGELARSHSEDATTRSRGGDLGELRAGALPAQLERIAFALEPGDVSAPLVAGDDLIILKLVERAESELPSYEEARAELGQRVYLEKMNRARQHWLDMLRRRTHIDVRL
jgi:peptidyl-prolyl cis-trans isomerase SurA